MKFESTPLSLAEGKLIAHNVAKADGTIAFRKGKRLTPLDLAALRGDGYSRVFVTESEPGDVDENHAARRIAEAAAGPGLELKGETLGKVSLISRFTGVLRVDALRLEKINSGSGIAFATLPDRSTLFPGQLATTVKIIPYALSGAFLESTETAARGATPVIQVLELKHVQVGLVILGLQTAKPRLAHSYQPALRRRIERLGSQISSVVYVSLQGEEDDQAVAKAITNQVDQGQQLILLAGESSILDRHDIAPRAVERAGGQVVCIGAPVDPGNLLMLAYLHGIPILGVPGCVHSPRENSVDRLLPSLLVGEQFSQADIARLGHGGLIQNSDS